MRRIFVILFLLFGMQFPALSYGYETASNIELEVRPLEENSTDIFSIFEILMEARQAFDSKDYETAANHYSLLVKYDPVMEEPIIGLAKSHLALNRPDLAEIHLSKTSVTSPEIEVLTVIAIARNSLPIEAELHLTKALKSHSDSRLWNLLGDVFIKTGQWQRALQAFHSAEKAKQKPGVLANNLGLLALYRGDFDVALRYLDQAVFAAQHSIKFDNNRRLALLLKGDYLTALENLTQSRAIDILADAGVIATQRGDIPLAKQLSLTASKINPQYIKN